MWGTRSTTESSPRPIQGATLVGTPINACIEGSSVSATSRPTSTSTAISPMATTAANTTIDNVPTSATGYNQSGNQPASQVENRRTPTGMVARLSATHTAIARPTSSRAQSLDSTAPTRYTGRFGDV